MTSPQAIAEARLGTEIPAQDKAWWSAWDDPQLDRLMAQSLSGNPDLRVARARIEQAEATGALAKARTLPTLSAGSNLQWERFSLNQFFPPPIGGSSYWNNDVALSFSYELDLWGQHESALAAAVDEVHAEKARAWQVRLGLAAAVAQAYAQFALQWELRDLAREELQRVDNVRRISLRRQRQGLGSGQDVEGLVVAVAQQQARASALDTALLLARHQLAALAGLGPVAGDTLVRPQLADASNLPLPAHLAAVLIGRRPDVIAQRWRVEAAGHHIESAKAAFYPNIDLLAFVGFQSLGFDRFLESTSGMSGIGPAISLPIFDGGRRRSQLSRETAAFDEAVEAYNGIVVRALQEVAAHGAALAGNGQETGLARNALAASQRRHSAAERGRRAGVIPYSVVLDAQSSVINARENLARLEAARRMAYAGLVLALGGAWPDEPAPALVEGLAP